MKPGRRQAAPAEGGSLPRCAGRRRTHPGRAPSPHPNTRLPHTVDRAQRRPCVCKKAGRGLTRANVLGPGRGRSPNPAAASLPRAAARRRCPTAGGWASARYPPAAADLGAGRALVHVRRSSHSGPAASAPPPQQRVYPSTENAHMRTSRPPARPSLTGTATRASQKARARDATGRGVDCDRYRGRAVRGHKRGLGGAARVGLA